MTDDYYINAFLIPARAKLEKALKEITYVDSCIDDFESQFVIHYIRNAIQGLNHSIQELTENQEQEALEKRRQARLIT